MAEAAAKLLERGSMPVADLLPELGSGSAGRYMNSVTVRPGSSMSLPSGSWRFTSAPGL